LHGFFGGPEPRYNTKTENQSLIISASIKNVHSLIVGRRVPARNNTTRNILRHSRGELDYSLGSGRIVENNRRTAIQQRDTEKTVITSDGTRSDDADEEAANIRWNGRPYPDLKVIDPIASGWHMDNKVLERERITLNTREDDARARHYRNEVKANPKKVKANMIYR
jgi:hypothetical protein